jgi:hypothetical protein
MEKEPRISKLFRESGIVRAPDGFTRGVMDRIGAEPQKVAYKPLIGRGGRILLILFIAGIVVISLLYSTPGDPLLGLGEKISLPAWQPPEWKLDLNFISRISISPWLLSTVVALFLLVLSDAGLSRRKKLT